MEGRTLIDEMYATIRSGPYYRKQRLDLARNASVAVRKHAERLEPPVLSILLADTNGARYPTLLDALPVERGRLEVILCDVFDRESPLVTQHADTVIVLGQNEHLYNRNVAFNTALTANTGQMVVFCDGDHPLPAEALAAIADKARACATKHRGSWKFCLNKRFPIQWLESSASFWNTSFLSSRRNCSGLLR